MNKDGIEIQGQLEGWQSKLLGVRSVIGYLNPDEEEGKDFVPAGFC